MQIDPISTTKNENSDKILDTLKDQSEIRKLFRDKIALKAKLKEYYYFDHIPPQYFDLPEHECREPLTLVLQELPQNLYHLFPIDLMLSF
ncbi:15111_t:CDS:2 [Gigaspora margarita]|uniref:15111_t:CDS:1 n=1 Tax=Gigaspora margarita TaxID=4874 RepID=A0ABN7UKL1_GIGMA|nr:15111_t:CDS:2 [Gigaspora margarita]